MSQQILQVYSASDKSIGCWGLSVTVDRQSYSDGGATAFAWLIRLWQLLVVGNPLFFLFLGVFHPLLPAYVFHMYHTHCYVHATVLVL